MKLKFSARKAVHDQARSQGGSEGADEPPFFRTKKKKIDAVRVWQLRVQVRSRLHRPRTES